MADKDLEKKGMSFRGQLVSFGMVLVLIVALPALFVEVQRPWDALDEMIGKGDAALSGIYAGFDRGELSRMNRFALKVSGPAAALSEDHLIWAFGLFLEKGALASPAEMEKALRDAGSARTSVDEAGVKKAFQFWQDRFAAEPGLLDLFRKYKKFLVETRQTVRQSGFDYKDAYLMADDGKTFVFVIDGQPWTGTTYPGLKFDTASAHMDYWRAYWQKGPGFDANPEHYSLGLFPKFDTDRWGTWFTVWLAEKDGDLYNAFSMDFDAARVKRLMWTVGGTTIVISLLLIGLIVIVTRRLARAISVPIDNLIAGTEAIMRMDYDHQVKAGGSREFQRPIRVFNEMIQGLKERLNLMQTIEKLLSKELAAQVAEHGMVLGGQQMNVTNLFTDFAGFSTISRALSPEDTVNLLNDYFSILVPIVKKWGGFPDKYIGDAIVAIFGAPVPFEEHAERAAACALEMQKAMRELNDARRKAGRLTLEMRIGLNSGDAVAGAIGSDLKLEYTTIGETTNLANRMESMSEIGQVLMAEATYLRVKHVFFEGAEVAREPEMLKVKGYDQPVPGHRAWASRVKIQKNEAATGPEDFYILETVDRDLNRKLADLEPEVAKQYTKVVKIA